ncbi:MULTISPECIES: AAA family ATPase [Pseudomonas]|uniref:AAA family ATPase n=1 Tax=Pseudomonas taiwanensis TaxID=470150 RepID=A0ABR6V3X7_9PSED|nr:MULTISPECIES: AAA family ATPase [Pseudomonas]AVD87493.1 cell division protein [Pseudomonas sp. SWI44]MBC3474577.1 AAA family ATPase [Pseudomonas taiwanensis]MBC3491596.1 AAA family ATPase [Pseudomonas taiwanensis]MDT8926341.1 AAA family ATPase [Pseudomonas taiwanensis]MPS97088.1 cell division protein [Pseudomonas sp.]
MTSLHADEAFLDHYQLSHDPFAPRVPGFKFFPAQRKPVLGQLHHLARYSHLMLVVTGPVGSGKTLLRQALVASTNKQSVQSVVVSARGASDAASVLGQVAQSLSVAQPEVQAILSQVVQLALTGQEVYLLVDDAEQLDESALQALLELAAGMPEGRPHVFLFGEPSLIAGLEAIEVEEERFHIIELAPYSEEETREYLEQRLDGAGRGIEVFTREQIVDIHENSDGWPGNINQVARDTLIEAMIASRGTAKRPTMGFKMPKKHVLALSAVVVVAVAAAVLMPKKSDKAPAEAPAAQAQLPLGEGQPGAAQSNNGGPAIEFSGTSQPMPLPLVGQSQPVMREPLAQAAGMGEGEEGSPAGDTALQPGTPPTVTTIAPPQGVAAGPAPTPAQPVTTAPVQPVAPAQKPVATQPAKPVAPTKPAQAPTQVAAAKPAAKPAEKPAAGGSGNSGWYAGQKPGNYVVQILGTSSEASAQAFVKAQGGDYRYFKKNLQGKPLYVVTYGNFANRDAAVAAIKNLPAKVQAGKPWPRTVASVQQELASAR